MSVKSRLLKSHITHRVTATLGSYPEHKTWLFIVGCYNSGTTLLADLLGSHTLISRLPYEGVVMSDCLPRPEEFGWTRMWARCESQMQIPAESASRVSVRCQKQLGFWHESSAKYYLEKSIARSPRNPDYRYYLGNAFREVGEKDKAAAQWRMVLALNPDHPEKDKLMEWVK